jgi:ADP-ribosylglycohydrolase
MIKIERCKEALYASIIGDALGVPVESSTRQELALCAVKNMLGYGRYDQPEGTWSDDTSMILCTMESLRKGYDPEDLGAEFCAWLFDGKWTPFGYAFDAGVTTVTALENIRSGMNTGESGCSSEDDNGNGSLMRILPAALYFSQEKINAFLARIHEVSAITHAHPRSKIGCGIYALCIRNLLETGDKESAIADATRQAEEIYSSMGSEYRSEMTHFKRITSHQILSLPKENVYSSGYIVHTLEAALWCFLNHSSSKEILLSAVNLGLDTDTTGTVAGGLAGLTYGLKDIPSEWIDALAQKKNIDSLINQFTETCARKFDKGNA